MTVKQLIGLLAKFPPDLPVFFCPDEAQRRVLIPQDAARNLVSTELLEVFEGDDSDSNGPHGFFDSVIIYGNAITF